MRFKVSLLVILLVIILSAGVFGGTVISSVLIQADSADIGSLDISQIYMDGQNRTDVLVSPVQSCSYLVYTDGTNYYAKNCTTGQTVFTSTNAEQTINYALQHLTAGRTWQETVRLIGNFTVDTSSYSSFHPSTDPTPWKCAIKMPAYSVLSGLTESGAIGASITLKNNASTVAGWPHQKNFIICNEHDGTDQWISVLGLEINGNHANQNTGINEGDTTINPVYGVQMQGIKHATVKYNYIHDVGETAIAFENPGDDIGQFIVASENTIVNTGQDGIGNTNNQMDTWYENNIVINAGINHPSTWLANGFGIMADGNRIHITGNNVNGSFLSGICAPGNLNTDGTMSGDISIVDNFVFSNSNHGIQTAANVRNIDVSNNKVFNNVMHGVLSLSSIAQFIGNTIYNNAYDGGAFSGLVINGGTAIEIGDNIIYDDQSTKTQGYGVALQNPTYVDVHNNNLQGNKNGPFLRYGTANNITLADNAGYNPVKWHSWFAVGNTSVIAPWGNNATLVAGVTYTIDGTSVTLNIINASTIVRDGRTINGLASGSFTFMPQETFSFTGTPTIDGAFFG